jgi:hypothetical protein
MRKIILGTLIGVMAVVLLTSVAWALPTNKKAQGPPEFVPQLSESKLTKIVFIRYAPGKAPACNDNDICEPGENWKKCPNDCKKQDEEPEEPACYEFLAGSKPRWNWVEGYYPVSSLSSVSAWATNVWNKATSATIFGNELSGPGPWGDYDYKNSIVFGNYEDSNVIAVTAIWFRGKNIYEYDIMFDDDYFPGEVDLDTVALHEFGHGAGLGDLYDTVCKTEVMHGIYDGVDLDLGPGDIVGIQALYGQ